MATSNNHWSEIFNAPKQSSSFGDAEPTIKRHDSFTRFAKNKQRFSGENFFNETDREKNPVAKVFKTLRRKFGRRK
jgi:hypothetical protein